MLSGLMVSRYHLLRVRSVDLLLFLTNSSLTRYIVSGTPSPTLSAAGVATVRSTSSTRVRVFEPVHPSIKRSPGESHPVGDAPPFTPAQLML